MNPLNNDNPALRPPGTAAPAPGGVAPNRRQGAGAAGGPGGAGEPSAPFADVLASVSATGQTGDLRFSRHALQRVQRRGINLDPSTLSRLREGVGRAAGKGSRDSVVLVDGTAFVVSVSNRTVLTAVLPEHMREQVFTNIDSAVIA
jgi:flagellar operon protein